MLVTEIRNIKKRTLTLHLWVQRFSLVRILPFKLICSSIAIHVKCLAGTFLDIFKFIIKYACLITALILVKISLRKET